MSLASFYSNETTFLASSGRIMTGTFNATLRDSAIEDSRNATATTTYNCSTVQETIFYEAEYFRSFSDSYRLFRYVLNFAILFSCAVLGLVGNALSFVVFRKSRKSMTSTFLLLQTLAIVDSLILVYCLFFISIPNLTMKVPTPLLNSYMRFIAETTPYSFAILLILIAAANWTVVLVAMERFIAICHPFRAKTLCTVSRTRKHIILVFALAVLFGLPRFWELETVTTTEEICQESQSQVGKSMKLSVVITDFGRNPVYVYVYKVVWHTLEIVVIPLVLVGYFNINLLASLHKMDEKGKRLFGQKATRRSTNIMLVVVMLVFIICQLPLCLTHILDPFRPFFTVRSQDNFQYALESAICLALVNHSLNFGVYFLAGKRFRETLTKTCFPCWAPYSREPNAVPLHNNESQQPVLTKSGRSV